MTTNHDRLPTGHDTFDAVARRNLRSPHEITSGLSGLRHALRLAQIEQARLAERSMQGEDTRAEELAVGSRLEELGRLIAAERRTG